MHVAPRLTTAAQQRWLQIPEQLQESILANVYCGQCPAAVQIIAARGTLDALGDIILRGRCGSCGSPVCRLIETGETPAQSDENE